ncbi:MAG: superoxide dismutase [Saprospiraceae bacterium]|nr:superoxide dismutase [Saprospiraceae bacterium]
MKNMKYILSTIISLCFVLTMKAQSPYSLPALPYSYAALEPNIDSTTMWIHHTKHHQAYINNLNQALQGTEAGNLSLNDLMSQISKHSVAIRNNGGGHYNHSLFWTVLTPNKNTKPGKDLMEAILAQYTSLDSLKSLINKAASTRFGSGWAWLSVNADGKLLVSSTANQDNPLMDVVTEKGIPILGIDVWEHAYYLKYQNKRGDYLNAIWNVVNWDEVTRRYHDVIPKKKGKFDEWPEIKTFHKSMSETFHPSEEGNLTPVRSRSNELLQNAIALSKSKIPTQFNNKGVQSAVKKLVDGSKALDKLVKNKASDKAITQSLSKLHDTFHLIVEECSH